MKERKIRRIEYSRKFLRSLSKLPPRVIRQANKKEVIFKQNCFAPQLKTHKLSGKDKDCWAFWVTDYYRIKFIFLSDEEVLFLNIGSHNIYQ